MPELKLRDHGPSTEVFLEAVRSGLSRTPKSLPYQFLYDDIGAVLFEAITLLDEYYPTRTELAIMADHAAEMAACLGRGVRLVEPGSGSQAKIRCLLEHLEDVRDFVPIDIARDQLENEAQIFAREFPQIPVHPLCADFTSDLTFPPREDGTERVCVYYPGSTIGNFTPESAREFLARMASWVRPGGAVLIGVDLKKDTSVLLPAYDDPRGVTAAFTKNLLARINRELGADFDVRAFAHRSIYNASPSRVELQLVSLADQTVLIDGEPFIFAAGEPIGIEYSHKPSLSEFAALARDAGLGVQRVWTDPRRWFSVQLLEPLD